jgi:hypothetical protein
MGSHRSASRQNQPSHTDDLNAYHGGRRRVTIIAASKAIITMNAIANAHICLLNSCIWRAFSLISSVTPLSADDLKKLEASRDWWQASRSRHFSDLLLMTKLVAWGVILEGPELGYEIIQLIKRWRKKVIHDHAPGLITIIGLVGWGLVSVGVAGEFWVDTWVNNDDDNIQSINITLLRDAHTSASAAHDLAQSASDIAGPAKTAADSAKLTAGEAQQKASNALTLASGARKEADTFEGDIQSARQGITDVTTHLKRITTPRTLTGADDLISKLKTFKGTKYVFDAVGADKESVDLLKAINDILEKAEWVRDKSVGGFPAINVYGNDKPDFSVPVALISGIQVSADSPEALDALQSRNISQLPQYLQAAIALDLALPSAITPSAEDTTPKVLVVKGTSTTVRITVGIKPLQ